MMYPLNLNECVKVKLTEDGLRLYREYWLKLGLMGNEPRIGADGYYETELWGLMEVFGPELYNGQMKVFFEGNNIFLTNPPV